MAREVKPVADYPTERACSEGDCRWLAPKPGAEGCVGPYVCIGKEKDWPDCPRALRAQVAALEADAKLNAQMLARQTDLAREAETRAAEAERLLDLADKCSSRLYLKVKAAGNQDPCGDCQMWLSGVKVGCWVNEYRASRPAPAKCPTCGDFGKVPNLAVLTRSCPDCYPVYPTCKVGPLDETSAGGRA